MKTEISAGGVVVRKFREHHQVLLIKDMNNNWTFPKGIIENNEEAGEAAKREIMEETGLSSVTLIAHLSPIHYIYRRNGLIQKTVYYFLFRTTSIRKTLTPQRAEGISDARWMTLNSAVSKVGYPETNRSLLAQVKQLLGEYTT